MSKTPVSVLQEFAAKKNILLPSYQFMYDRLVSSNDHEFLIRVSFNKLFADGKGPTKQIAKQNAAQKMLVLLESKNSMEPLVQPLNCLQINESPEVGINYIGLLHEFCAKSRIKMPVFADSPWGPDHQMNFKIKCQVADVTEEGTGTTKKAARTAAAKAVYAQLCKENFKVTVEKKKELQEINEDLGLNFEELKIDEILPDYNKENKIAIERYLKLTKLTVTPLLNEIVTVENCHQIFTSEKYSATLRKEVLNLLAQVNTENPLFFETYLSIIEEIATLLKVQLKSFNLTLNRSAVVENVEINYSVAFKLYTEPAIFGVGDGATVTLARLRAILNIRNNLRLLLI